MRFPAGLYLSIGAAFLRNGFSRQRHTPLVLMLEPTHNCNLDCAGCDRIRLYRSQRAPDLTLEECLEAVEQTHAPVVTVTGGEPLLYPHLKPLLARLLAMNRYVYLCTNGLLTGKFVREERPHPRLMLNFHLDGMALTHDALAGTRGTFARSIAAVREATKRGFTVCTNTSVYRNSDPGELKQLFLLLSRLKVKGMLVSPAFAYESVGSRLFPDRREIVEKFRALGLSSPSFRFLGTPLYLQFLRGERTLRCMPWGSPTRNPLGWKAPCYFITDAYYPSFNDMIEKTDWETYGSGRDKRCENCMVHCGYEPGVMDRAFSNPLDMMRLALWNMEIL